MTNLQDFEEKFNNLVVDANEVIQFKLIRRREDLENNEIAFRPYMAHQFFGDEERIFGYADLSVQVYYTAGPLHIYMVTKYSKRADELSNGEIKADNVIATIAEKLPEGCYYINLDEFLKTLDKAEKFQPFGEKLCEFKGQRQLAADISTDESFIATEERHFEIYHCDYATSQSFFKFFGRLQTFIMWFIDAANYIDVEDTKWNYFVCYEKYKNDNGDYQFATVGYTTVYEYYAYPQNKRPRISQMLVLPPFQKLGIGTKSLEAIYNFYRTQKEVIDLTVEDQSEDFKRMRNCLDARLCLNLKAFNKAELQKGYNKEMEREARESLKLNPRQVRKVYEILRLYHTNIHNESEYKAYRLEIKKRLNSLFFKQLSDIKKMEKFKLDTELLRASLPSKKQRIEQLKDEYEEVEKEYMQIINKMRC